MTAEKLARLEAEGFGQGRYECYRPWIRVRRSLSSPVSSQHVFEIPGHGRHAHLLSGLEQQFALLAGWLGALEVREQFPVHPRPARHPGYDPTFRYPVAGAAEMLPGIADIARDAGIDPGIYPGTNLPFVLTTDLVLLSRDANKYRLAYWPVKPSDELDGPNGSRRRERLELEARHAALAGADFRLMTDETVGRKFMENLQDCKPWRGDVEQWSGDDRLYRFAEGFNSCRGAKLRDAWAAAGAFAGLEKSPFRRRLFNVAVWLGLLDVHLSKDLYPHLAVPWGGLAQRTKMRQRLLGVSE